MFFEDCLAKKEKAFVSCSGGLFPVLIIYQNANISGGWEIGSKQVVNWWGERGVKGKNIGKAQDFALYGAVQCVVFGNGEGYNENG